MSLSFFNSTDTHDKNLFAQHRANIMEKLLPDSIVILPSAPVAHRNGDIDYVYRQDSNFYYLTGFNESESVAILASSKPSDEFILFNLPRDPAQETWTGKRAGQEGACKIYGANQAFPISEFKNKLPGLISKYKNIYFPVMDPHVNHEIKQLVQTAAKQTDNHPDIHDVTPMLENMRQIKSTEEINVIRKAVAASEQGHLAAMRRCKPGLYEYQLEAELMHEFLNAGAHATSYPNIVGSGENTCILHYEENDKQIHDGDMVLIDAAAEYQNYSADITRTFPANGKFTSEQRAVYELVLKAQTEAINAVKPGALFADISQLITRIITQGLLDLNLLSGNLDELLKKKAYLPFYMHGPGHWIGLDVHDAGSRPNRLLPGMVLTMEPGIYISSTIPNVPSRWHNIGVRIEDCLLVTETGCEVLSSRVPKQVAEIEKIMAENKKNQRKFIPSLFGCVPDIQKDSVDELSCNPRAAQLPLISL